MKSTKFLGQIPQQFLSDPETREFLQYLINYISDVQGDTKSNTTTLSEQSDQISAVDAFTMRSFSASDDSASDALSFQSLSFADSEATAGDSFIISDQVQYHSVLHESGTMTAVSGDFIAARGTVTINLETYGKENSRIKIVNVDGTAVTIQGMIYNAGAMSSYTINSTTESAVYDFQFHVILNGWILV